MPAGGANNIPAILGGSSANAGAGETLTDSCVVVLFLGRGLHELVVNPGRNIVVLANFASGKLDFEGLRIFVVTNLGNINRGDRDPMHEEGPLSQGTAEAGEDCPLRS
jgi:hypothetical protein